ncbi:MAG: hypothetical protein ACFFEY_05900, partial [Candidatus Thorarchaeota archaeon]
LELYSSKIEEVVNFGSHVLRWCSSAVSGGGDEQLPLLLLFRHIFDLIEGTYKNGSVEFTVDPIGIIKEIIIKEEKK